MLVYEITGKQIPPGGLPLHVDCVVTNVETLINIGNALDGKPVVDKYVTINGAVESPYTTVVPVGTSFADCLRAAGGCTDDDPTLLVSGVMMGGITRDQTETVSKTTAGLIVLPSDHYLARRKSQTQTTYTRIGHGQCDQCSLCTELCPRYILGYPIEPHRVMRTLLMTGEAKERGSLWAQYCCECNICSYVACPEQLDPKNICVDAKALCVRRTWDAPRLNWSRSSANRIQPDKVEKFRSLRSTSDWASHRTIARPRSVNAIGNRRWYRFRWTLMLDSQLRQQSPSGTAYSDTTSSRTWTLASWVVRCTPASQDA